MRDYERLSDDDLFLSCCKFLDPDVLRANLHAIGVYLVAYELLKLTVIEKPRGFITLGLSDEDAQREYQTDILCRNRSPFWASMLWFQQMGAIDDADLQVAELIRQHRNALVHELPRFLSDASSNIDTSLFSTMLNLMAKIDRWWIREIEAPCRSDFDAVDVRSLPDSEITSGGMMMMQAILERVFGDVEFAKRQRDEFVAMYEKQAKMRTHTTKPSAR